MTMPQHPPPLLYVEDEPDDVFFLRAAFRRVGLPPDFPVVEDGEKAIAYFAGEPPYEDRERHPLPSLVLLDLNLPLRSGFEVLEWLRSRPEGRTLDVIIFSSSGRPEDRSRAAELGASGYLLKPASGLDFAAIASELKQAWLNPDGR